MAMMKGLISMPPSHAARIAQSRLANAVKSGLSDETVSALRTRFAVERAIDAIRAIPGTVGSDGQAALMKAVAENSSMPPQGGDYE